MIREVAGQPGADGGVFVGGVDAHQVQWLPRVDLGDLVEEPHELLVAVARHAGIDDLAGGYLQRDEQGAIPRYRGGAASPPVAGPANG